MTKKKQPALAAQPGGPDPLRAALDTHGMSLPEAHLAEAMRLVGASEADLRRAGEFVRKNETENAHETFEMVVLGDPAISKRPRAVRLKNAAGNTVGVRMYAPDAEDQMSIAEAVRRSVPAGFSPFYGEVELELRFFRPHLAGWPPYKRLLAELQYVRPEAKPDADNLAKLVVDAMRGIVFVDDGQVVIANLILYYGSQPRTEVRVNGRRHRMNK